MSAEIKAEAARKRAEAVEFRQVARTVSLETDRAWCLQQAEFLETQADQLEQIRTTR